VSCRRGRGGGVTEVRVLDLGEVALGKDFETKDVAVDEE
jgi:hypothetical protein